MCGGADASAAADAKSFKLNGLMAAERRGVRWVAGPLKAHLMVAVSVKISSHHQRASGVVLRGVQSCYSMLISIWQSHDWLWIHGEYLIRVGELCFAIDDDGCGRWIGFANYLDQIYTRCGAGQWVCEAEAANEGGVVVDFYFYEAFLRVFLPCRAYSVVFFNGTWNRIRCLIKIDRQASQVVDEVR